MQDEHTATENTERVKEPFSMVKSYDAVANSLHTELVRVRAMKKVYRDEKMLREEDATRNAKRIAELEAKLTDVESEFTQCKQNRDRFLEERNSARVDVNTLRSENSRIKDELYRVRSELADRDSAGFFQRLKNLFRIEKQ